jgi:hypothetical protein
VLFVGCWRLSSFVFLQSLPASRDLSNAESLGDLICGLDRLVLPATRVAIAFDAMAGVGHYMPSWLSPG